MRTSGSEVAVARQCGRVRVWDVDTGAVTRDLFAQCPNCWCLAYSPDGMRLVTGGDHPAVKAWDLATGSRLAGLPVTGMIRSVGFSPDGKHIVTSSGHRAVRFWDAATFQHLRSVEGHTDEARAIAFAPDGQRFATASFDGTVKVWAFGTRDEPAGAPPEP